MSRQEQKLNLDMEESNNNLWLVKVPKYIAKRWEEAPGFMEVGKLKVTKTGDDISDIGMSLSEAILAMDDNEFEIPKHYRLNITPLSNQTLGVISVDEEAEKLLFEGKVVKKIECKPFADNCYMNLKKETILKASIPNRKSQQLNKIVQCFKPVSHHNLEKFDKIKIEKNYRCDKNTVVEMLFEAFHKHQYYNIKDLVAITKQPVTYLKNILLEFCNYSFKQPHRNMWHLKPEYCSYSKEDENN